MPRTVSEVVWRLEVCRTCDHVSECDRFCVSVTNIAPTPPVIAFLCDDCVRHLDGRRFHLIRIAPDGEVLENEAGGTPPPSL